jgi:hypothetical protein
MILKKEKKSHWPAPFLYFKALLFSELFTLYPTPGSVSSIHLEYVVKKSSVMTLYDQAVFF